MATANIYDLTDTWNAGGTTFTAIKMNVTNTASAAGSMLLDLQVGSTTMFNVKKNGKVLALPQDTFNGTSCVYSMGDVGRGLFTASASTVALAAQQLAMFQVDSSALYAAIPGNAALGFAAGNAGNTIAAAPDTTLVRDGAADTLGQRRTTNSQTRNHYDTWTSATDYHRLAMKTARATLSNVSGASVTATALIPDGAVVLGVTTKVTTGLGTGNGTTGYTVGTVADPDRWGSVTGTASGTSTDNTNWTAGTIEAFTAASDVVITALTADFNATGVIYVSVQYLIGQCD